VNGGRRLFFAKIALESLCVSALTIDSCDSAKNYIQKNLLIRITEALDRIEVQSEDKCFSI